MVEIPGLTLEPSESNAQLLSKKKNRGTLKLSDEFKMALAKDLAEEEKEKTVESSVEHPASNV